MGDTQFVKHFPAKNEMGKPVTLERNMFPGPARGGVGKKGLFTEEKYITVGDKYIDTFKRDRQDELKEKKKIPFDQAVMKPQNKTHLMGKMPYVYKEEMDMSRGKPVVRDLDEMGKPVTQPTNMKAAINVDKMYKKVLHIPDEFNR